MKRARLILLGLALAVPAPVAAQDAAPPVYQPSEEYQQCMRQGDAARGNPTAVRVCIGLEQTVQIERMGEAYDRAFDSLTGWDQVRLHNAQTEWRATVEGRCADMARNNPQRGTDSSAFNVCLTLEYAARAAWLDDYSPE